MQSKIFLNNKVQPSYSANVFAFIIDALQSRINAFIDGFLFQVVTTSADYSALISDSIILCDASSGAITITLLDPKSTQNKILIVKKIETSANAVTVQGASGNIEGAATNVIAGGARNFGKYVSDGSAYWKIG